MKSQLSYFLILFFFSTYSYAQQTGEISKSEFKIITIVESISHISHGESRIIDSQTEVSASEYETYSTDGSKAKNKELEIKKLKIDSLEETKLFKMYDQSEVSYKNIARNDSMISSKINSMITNGWKLTFVTSAVETNSQSSSSNGVLITRLFFSR